MADISRIVRIFVSVIVSVVILFNPILMLISPDKPLSYILSTIVIFVVIVFMLIYSACVMNLKLWIDSLLTLW